MKSRLVGVVELQNGERVYVTALVRPIEENLRREIQRLRESRILDSSGKPIQKLKMLAFGTEPNPDADDGTEVGMFLDVTRADAV